MEKQIRQHKIEYLMQYTNLLCTDMMRKIDNQKTVLYTLRNILVSPSPLEECRDYEVLDEYFKQQEPDSIHSQKPDITLLRILSNMVNIMNKGLDTEYVGQIISYYPYIETEQPKVNTYTA